MADGAMTSSFIPVFTAYRHEKPDSEAWDFARRMFWNLAAVLSGVTLLGIIFAPEIVRFFTLASAEPGKWTLAITLTRLTFPYCLLIALTALAGAILNTLRVYWLPASVPIYLNLAIIAGAIAAWLLELPEPAIALALGVVAGGVLQVLVQVPALLSHGMPFGFRLGFAHPGVKRVARLMLPAVAGVGLYQINVVVSTIFASQQEGWISALYYADRLMEIALGVYAVSVATVVLPVLSQQAVEKQFDKMRETLAFALRNVAFIILPAAVGLMVLGVPIVRMLFEHSAFGANSTDLTAWALLFYAVGLPAFAAVRIMVQGFYAVQDTATPVRLAAVALIANILLCALLVTTPLRHGGLALATSLASYINLVLLYLIFRRRLGGVDEGRLVLSLARSTLAALGMGAACWWLAREFALATTPNFLWLVGGVALTITAGLGVYLALAWLLRADELSEFYTLVTGRQIKKKEAGVETVLPATPLNR